MQNKFHPGQRWLSSAEPELGIGIVLEVEERRVQIQFPAAEEVRLFVVDNAPLSRLQFHVGETIQDETFGKLLVQSVAQVAGCNIYTATDDAGETFPVPEQALSATLQFNGPKARLMIGQVDHPAHFELRAETLSHLARLKAGSSAGLLGPRVQLLPHQLFVADEICRRQYCRVLLADEVGLGKTIEAGLVLHRLIWLERVQRAIIVVPGALLHQWLVEMLRRFNLQFTILDEERCEAISEQEDSNPFESAQLILVASEWLSEDHLRGEQAISAGWDMLIVDEAHHLNWQESGEQDAEYALIAELAQSSTHALFLTGTPQKAGLAGHFGQLRLLDPDRFSSLAGFAEEQQNYGEINDLILRLSEIDSSAEAAELSAFTNYCDAGTLAALKTALAAGADDDIDAARRTLQNDLLDRFGTGRLLFRNSRAGSEGFPVRRLHIHELEAAAVEPGDSLAVQLQPEQLAAKNWCQFDARVTWLDQFLKQNRRRKILLICASDESAEELEEYLRLRRGHSTSLFCKGLNLIERDRAAAWFADIEYGAQILICSEIGSEGRNFQFASDLILLDLPLNPDLLEQRIGRLDRLGQEHDVEIHLPVNTASAGHRLARWYHEVLDAFEKPCSHGYSVYQRFQQELETWLVEGDEAAQKTLFETARNYSAELRADLDGGRNRLLELNSCNPERAAQLISNISADEGGEGLGEYIEQMSAQLGIETEHHSEHAVILRPGDHMLVEAFPGLPEEGLSGTFNRDKALSREDLAWLTWEHPLIVAGMDLVMNSELGSTSLVTLAAKGLRPGSILVEAIYRIDVVAPARLQLSGFLQTPVVRLLVDDQLRSLADKVAPALLNQLRKPLKRHLIPKVLHQLREPLAAIIDHLDTAAQENADAQAQKARQSYAANRSLEQNRLEALARVNGQITEREIAGFIDETSTGVDALKGLQCTLECLRILVVEG